MARFEVPSDRDARDHAWALTGEMGERARDFSRTVYETGRLPLREFEAVRMRVAQLNGCRLCMAYRTARDHATRGQGEPIPDEAFYAAVEEWQTTQLLTNRERLAVEFAERYTCAPDPLAADDAFWQRLQSAFTDVEIVEMAMCISAFFTRGRFAHVMGIDDTCEILPPPIADPVSVDRAAV
ncbi:MAG: carboxymuconolactone decarboxylase family protein [Acidimicrobiia bacterium]